MRNCARLARPAFGYLILASLALSAACSSGSEEQTSCDGGQAIPIKVSSPHTQPKFSWAGTCPIWTMQVSYVDANSTVVTVWSFAVPDASNIISPPVTYGIVPAGADTPLPPISLVPGQAYTVRISGWDPIQGTPAFIGLGTFVH